MDTCNIRQTIAFAKQHESKTAHLADQLSARAGRLHRAIQLPSENTLPALVSFVTRYIDHVPEFIDAVETITTNTALEECAGTVTTIAKDFFSQPPELIDGHKGMNALMDEAYLSHRLIEEINDPFIVISGSPLIPMDMTRSNLIIHHLIGEPFANQLDQAVHLIVNHLINFEKSFSTETFTDRLAAASKKVTDELRKWPCLMDTLSIQFVLNRGIRL